MDKAKIIAIETSGRHGSVAVAEGPELIEEIEFATDRDHARDLLPTVAELCRRRGWKPTSLDHCYLSIGPGSFTGLRIGVTFARHFALASGVKICAVGTLDVIAENALELDPVPTPLAVVLDAKRACVYCAIFQLADGSYRRRADPRMVEPAEIFSGEQGMTVIGEGIDHHAEAIEAMGAAMLDRRLWHPRAANVHRLGWRMAAKGNFTDPVELTPEYIRRPEAEELWEKRHGQGTAGPDVRAEPRRK